MPKIYTKTGDEGFTSLLLGKRVKKNSLYVDIYGQLDELNAFVGLVTDALSENKLNKQLVHITDFLITIQREIFVISSFLATGNTKKTHKFHLPAINYNLIKDIENHIDNMQNKMPVLKNFIIPGGSVLISYIHIARTICRRVERIYVAIHDKTKKECEFILQFLNRFSDYLFVLARYIGFLLNIPERIFQYKK